MEIVRQVRSKKMDTWKNLCIKMENMELLNQLCGKKLRKNDMHIFWIGDRVFI